MCLVNDRHYLVCPNCALSTFCKHRQRCFHAICASTQTSHFIGCSSTDGDWTHHCSYASFFGQERRQRFVLDSFHFSSGNLDMHRIWFHSLSRKIMHQWLRWGCAQITFIEQLDQNYFMVFTCWSSVVHAVSGDANLTPQTIIVTHLAFAPVVATKHK